MFLINTVDILSEITLNNDYDLKKDTILPYRRCPKDGAPKDYKHVCHLAHISFL